MKDNMFRCRYGRVENTRHPKNTLMTFQEDDIVYFGISRCSTKPDKNGVVDKFNKTLGREIASNRAKLTEYEGGDNNYSSLCDVMLHNSGLRGFVSVDHIQQLIVYFEEIDCLSMESQ